MPRAHGNADGAPDRIGDDEAGGTERAARWFDPLPQVSIEVGGGGQDNGAAGADDGDIEAEHFGEQADIVAEIRADQERPAVRTRVGEDGAGFAVAAGQFGTDGAAERGGHGDGPYPGGAHDDSTEMGWVHDGRQVADPSVEATPRCRVIAERYSGAHGFGKPRIRIDGGRARPVVGRICYNLYGSWRDWELPAGRVYRQHARRPGGMANPEIRRIRANSQRFSRRAVRTIPGPGRQRDPKGEGMSETNSTLPRRQLGRYLREARESIGLTLVEAAKLMEWSKSALQRLEKGQTERIRTHNIVLMGEIYQLEREEVEDLKALAEQAAVKSWWHEYGSFISPSFDVYMGLESVARGMTSFQQSALSGLLQTAEYARTLDRGYFPHDSEDQIAKRVELRLRRQGVITRNRQPAKLAATVHEAALRTVIGGPKVMAAQLRHLADLSTYPNIDLRVLAFRTGLPVGVATGPFTILDFGQDEKGIPPEPTVVYAEAFTGAMYFEKDSDVSKYSEAYETMQRAALDVRPTRDLLRGVAREYEREC